MKRILEVGSATYRFVGQKFVGIPARHELVEEAREKYRRLHGDVMEIKAPNGVLRFYEKTSPKFYYTGAFGEN
jgi:hypothetical protein